MMPADEKFITECLRRYYYERFAGIEIPEQIKRREFGYRRPGSGMIRHQPIRNGAALRAILMQELPLEVFVSPARYLFPTLPMREKEWQGAELTFDIDAKDLNLECRREHTIEQCSGCGRPAAGRCPCGSASRRSVSVTCKDCIDSAKGEVKRLRDILRREIGVKRVYVYFSGNEGFHVHVPDKALLHMDKAMRMGSVDYVMFRGILPERLGMKKDGSSSLPHPADAGWPGRFARHMYGSKRPNKKKERETVSAGYGPFARMVEGLAGVLGVRIDPNVTPDIHRIFRMPGTVNGKSGMSKVPCNDLDGFDPYNEAVLFHDDAVLVRANCPAKFTLKQKVFGPYDNELVDLPAYAAAYMVCKGLAHVEG